MASSSNEIFHSAQDLLASPAQQTNETLSANAINELDTQPLTSSNIQESPSFNRRPPWGLLYGLNSSMPQTSLVDDEYAVGRTEGPPVDITIPKPNEGDKHKLNMWLSYSRVQFIIRRLSTGNVVIEDRSSNGTFVNGKKLAKRVPTPLQNNSEISLSVEKNCMFVYADLSILEDLSLPMKLRKNYRFAKTLGSGACGEVRLAFNRAGGNPVAVKVVHRSKFLSNVPKTSEKHNQYNQALREAKLMQKLSHPNIIKILEVIDDEDHDDMFLVLEYAAGGELFDRIVSNKKLEEPVAKFICYQSFLAIQYLHSHGITHRDLKPENILLASQDEYPVVKLADFGLSKILAPGTVLRTYCGTPAYLAPEIVKTKGNGQYTKKVDVWSMGVIVFAMLAGYPPFYETAGETVEEKIVKGSYSFPVERWFGVTPGAISFIKRLLTVNPMERLSADQVLRESWLASDSKMLDQINDIVFNGKGIVYHFATNRNVISKPILFKRPGHVEDREDALVRPASAADHREPKEIIDREDRPASAATERSKRRKILSHTDKSPIARMNRPFFAHVGEKIVSPARRFLAQHRNGEQNQTPAKVTNDNLTDLKTPKILKVGRK